MNLKWYIDNSKKVYVKHLLKIINNKYIIEDCLMKNIPNVSDMKIKLILIYSSVRRTSNVE